LLSIVSATFAAGMARASAVGVSIGVTAYVDPDIVGVPAAAADARSVQLALGSMGGAGGITLLAGSAEDDAAPDRHAILSALAAVGLHEADADLAVIYFAGQVMSAEGQGYLLGADTDLGDLPGTAAPLSAVANALSTARAKNRLLVLAAATGAASPDDAFYEALVQMRDVTVIVGCGPGEGLTATDEGGDAFTHFLVESLAASNGAPAPRKLAYSVWDTTRRWAEGKGAKQTPQYMPAGRGAPTREATPDEIVVMDTTKGRIVIKLYPEDAPEHVANFKKLVREGFYDGEAGYFHRYVKNFVIQGGDPQRTGRGGPGYTVPAEIGRKHLKGSVAAARTGDNVNPDRRSSGSQFYICLKRLFQLDRKYSVFGQVIEGMDAVSELRIGDEIEQARVVLASEYGGGE